MLAQRFIDRVRELNRTVGIPDKIACAEARRRAGDRSRRDDRGARDYPVPKNMSLAEAETLLQRMQA